MIVPRPMRDGRMGRVMVGAIRSRVDLICARYIPTLIQSFLTVAPDTSAIIVDYPPTYLL